jgi:hypothetical protein
VASICLVSYPQEQLKVTKISSEIKFDGIPDEECWRSIEPLKLTMHKPDFGNEPTESTRIKIAYDKNYFYVSGAFHYKDPASIHAVSKKRDYKQGSCDWFSVQLDTYNDKQNAWFFMTNPNGLRSDGSIKNDDADNNTDNNITWNTFWDVKTVVKDSNWYSEFRIPFSSLRYQNHDGKTVMGLIVLRSVAAKTEVITFPPISLEYSTAYRKPSLSAEILFEGLQPKNPLYFTPYVTCGISQMPELNEEKTGYVMKSTPKYDAGFDAKFGLTKSLTLDVTVNTDFAQVEADDQKINLTRYSLVFPEKRVFFLEKEDVFDFSFLDGNNLFYSRKMGIYNSNPVRIYGGVRLTGKIDKWDLGIFDMQTAPYTTNPGENFSVIRTKRTVFNKNSFVGGMYTGRLGMNGNYNISYGIDGQFRIIGDEYLIMKLAQTFEKDSLKKVFDLSPTKIMLQWQRRNLKGFAYDFLYTYSGDRFNPGIGFELKDNYQNLRCILQYGWFAGKDALYIDKKLSITANNIWNTVTRQQETFTAVLNWHTDYKSGASYDINGNWFREDLDKTLTLGNKQATVPPGRYSFASVSAKYTTNTRKSFSGNITAETGSFYDGWKTSLATAPMLDAGANLNLSLTYNLDIVNFSYRDTKFTNHIVGFKGLLTLTTKTSLSAFIQYNTSVNKVMTNIRFRFNPREGNDFYIVYDEGLNTNLLRDVPKLTYSAGRTILLKYTYTFIL